MIMKILMIDNYDSFTYNLVHYMESNPYEVEIIIKTPDELHELSIDEENIIGMVISPGPSHPKDRQDVIHFVEKNWGTVPVFESVSVTRCCGICPAVTSPGAKDLFMAIHMISGIRRSVYLKVSDSL